VFIWLKGLYGHLADGLYKLICEGHSKLVDATYVRDAALNRRQFN